LTPLQKEVDDIINGDDIKNQSPNTFFKIASVHQKAGDVANQLRKSEQYQALQLMAEKTKDPEIVKKVTIFRERLEELALMSLEYDSVFEARKILTTDKQLNVLTKLKSKIGAMQAGIQKGERRLEFFNLESRNTSKSITEFETDIREKIKIG